MSKSSKTEDLPSSSFNYKQTKHSLKPSIIKSFFQNLFFRTKQEDSVVSAIKQIKSNVKKMTLDERNIFTNFLKFGDKTVEDVMIPRSDIVAVKLTINIEELSKMIEKHVPHTRTLVYEGTLDNIVGFIHIKDLFKTLITKQNFQLKKIVRKPIIAAPSMQLIDLLAKMRRDRTHIAIVVDEYGGTDGIVTIEDILEAIVGRIDDEHDKRLDSDSFKILNKNTILSNARVEVEDLEAVLGVKLKGEDDEFDTIGGLVLAKVGNVPTIGTIITISEKVELEVIDASPRTLKQVKLWLKNGDITSGNADS